MTTAVPRPMTPNQMLDEVQRFIAQYAMTPEWKPQLAELKQRNYVMYAMVLCCLKPPR